MLIINKNTSLISIIINVFKNIYFLITAFKHILYNITIIPSLILNIKSYILWCVLYSLRIIINIYLKFINHKSQQYNLIRDN